LNVGWLLGALRPTGPYPLLCITGIAGMAKTSACRVLQRLIDPNFADLRPFKKEDDMYIGAFNSWVLAFDNISRIGWEEARAREAQADKLFKECLTIADAARPEDVNVARLRVDTRKWAAARLAPKKYGDHISHDVKGGGINFQPQILISCSSAGEEQEYIDISAAPEAAGSLPQQGNGNSLPGSGGRR